MQRRRAILLLMVVLTSAIGSGAILLSQSEHSPTHFLKLLWSPVPGEQVLHGTPFRFAIQDRNWETGLSDEFSVDDHAHVRYAFEAGADRELVDEGQHVVFRPYRKVTSFDLSRGELAALRELIAEERFFALDDAYTDRNIRDGSHVVYTVQVGSATKTVSCSNASPDAIGAIHRYVYERLLVAHRDAVARAVRE